MAKNFFGLIAGIGVGAGLMYLFDPNGGRRRRALIRDKAVGIKNDVKKAVEKKTTDLGNRAQGLFHEAKTALDGKLHKETQIDRGI